MKMSSLLALDATDRAIGNFFVGLPVQRNPDRKTTRWLVSNYLNTANGLAPRPLSNSLQALLAESPVARSDRLRLRHTMRSKATWPSVARYLDLGVYAPVQSLKKQKTARFLPGGFSLHKSEPLFAVAEAPRPPSRAAGLGIGCRLGSGLGGWGGWRRWLRLAGTDGWWRRITLGIDQEAHLLAHRRTPPGGSFGFLSGLHLG
jgi:hypothetical protein